MNQGQQSGSSQPSRNARHTETPSSMTPKGRKRQRFDDAINAAIVVAKLARDAGDTSPLLGPLKASMGMLITLLENVKDVRKCEEDWETLSNHLADRISMLYEYIKDKSMTVDLLEIVSNYKEILERVVREIEPLARKHKAWYETTVYAKGDGDRIKDATRDMDEAFNKFTTQFQMQTLLGVAEIQNIQSTVHHELVSHRNDHAQSHARILEVQDGQRGLDQKMDDIRTEQEGVKTKLTETDEALLLKGLGNADMANGEIHETCMRGTREPILNQIRQWMRNEHPDTSQILWLADVAGSGKSTVAKHLSREWKSQGKLAGSFFFSRDAEGTRTTKLFFNTIAQQGLSRLELGVKAAISDGIRELGDPTSALLEEQCREIFVRPLKTTSRAVVLVLDAVDECEPAAFSRLFRVLLSQIANIPHLKLFLTSRPDKHIAKVLDIQGVHRTSLRSDEDSNREDVKLYMRTKLLSTLLPDDQIDKLVTRSRGLFIWASTVCRLVEDFQGNMEQYVSELLAHGPDEMDLVYQKALDQALPPSSQAANRKAYMAVLGLVVVAFQPMSPRTIDEMLGISNSFTIIQHLKSVLDCHQIDDPVRFLHPTFREFLLQSHLDSYRVEEKSSHLTASEACLRVMASNLRYDLCGLFNNNLEGDLDDDKLPDFNPALAECTTHALRYSCRFWGDHFVSYDHSQFLGEQSILSSVKQFFRHNLLDWIYVISIIGVINEIKAPLQKIILTAIDKQLASWANDTIRFIKMYWNDLKKNPLCVYSLFSFAPKSTIFQVIYAKSTRFPHPVVTTGLDDDWSSHVLAKVHQIRTARLSRCGNWFVTGGKDGLCPVYGIWDVKIGDGEIHIHPCGTSGCCVSDIRFNDYNDMLRLQTFCTCGSLLRWDVLSSSRIPIEEIKLECRSESEWENWSDDGKAAIRTKYHEGSFIYDLWKDENPSEYHRMLVRESSKGVVWTFSPGRGDKLACCRDEGQVVEILDSVTKEIIWSQEFFCVWLLTFAPDAKTIIFADDLTGMHCLSVENGESLWNIEFNASNGAHIGFYPDNRMIVTAEAGLDIQIISSLDGSLLYRPQSSLAGINYFFPHPESEQMIIIPYDDSVILWSPSKVPDIQYSEYNVPWMGERHFSWQHSVLIGISWEELLFSRIDPTSCPLPPSHSEITDGRLSPNGLILATVTKDNVVTLWDVPRWVQLFSRRFTFRDALEDIKVEFSKDSSILLAWSAVSEEIQSIQIPQRLANSLYGQKFVMVAFLSVAEHLLIVDGNGNINVYSLNGALLGTFGRLSFQPSTPGCHSLTISLDDKLMAFIDHESLIIKEIFENSRELIWPGAYIGMAFTLDCSHILVVERPANEFVVTHLRISDMAIQNRWVRRDEGLIRVIPNYHINTLEIVYKWASKSRGTLVSSFDLRSGKRTISPTIHHGKYSVYFGRYRIMDTGAGGYASSILNWESSDRLAIWFEKPARIFIVDMSLLIEHTRGQLRLTPGVEQWKYDWLDWCTLLPDYISRLHREDDIEEVEKWLEGIEQFERTTKELKELGILTEVMRILKGDGEDQKLSERLDQIESDSRVIASLKSIWQDRQLEEIMKFKLATDRRLQAILQEHLKHIRQKGRLHLSRDPWCEQCERLYRLFICFRRFRDTLGHQKSEWPQLYQEFNDIEPIDHGHNVLTAWRDWMPIDFTSIRPEIRQGKV